MIELGIARGPDPTERRSYSSLILGAVEAAARGGGSPGVAWVRSAACEIATVFWARGLASATVEPRNRRTAALTPLTCTTIARRLARTGEYLAVLDVRDGRLALDEAWDRDGDHRRAAVNPSEMAGRVNGSAVLRSAPALRVTNLTRSGSEARRAERLPFGLKDSSGRKPPHQQFAPSRSSGRL